VLALPHPRERGDRHRGGGPEADEADRMPWHVEDRPQQVLVQRLEGAGRSAEGPSPRVAVVPEPGRGLVDGAEHHCGGAVVEGMREIDLGPAPLQAVSRELQ
jgi:hypothetical protein